MNSPTYIGGQWKVTVNGVEVILTPEQVLFSPAMESILRDQLLALSNIVTGIDQLTTKVGALEAKLDQQNTIVGQQRDLIAALKSRAENPDAGIFMGQRYVERRLTAEAVEASYPGQLYDIMGVSSPGDLPR